MTRDLERIGRDVFDLLVVGGGVYGLAAAYDAASRGLSVALVEREDFGGRTSFNHLKTIHGGLRQLQRGDLVRMRESTRERRTFARIAPQFLVPQPFLVPTTRSPRRHRLAMRIAFAIDRAIGFDRNQGLPASLALPPGRMLNRAALAEIAPDVHFEHVTGGALWFDYKTEESERLTWAFALAAARHGAVLVNQAEAVAACREGMQVTGMRVRDALTGEACVVRARVICNAAGASVGRIIAAFGSRRTFPLVKAMNVVTRRPAWPVAVGSPTRGGRLLIALPWHGRLAIGTSHGEEPAGADATYVNTPELESFLAEINEAFPSLHLDRDEVALVHRGVVPARLHRSGSPRLLEHSLLLDHARDGIEGALSMVGVKYTLARVVAERAVDLTVRKLGIGPLPSRTSSRPLIDTADGSPVGRPHGRVEPPPSDDLARLRSLYEPEAFGRLVALVTDRPQLQRRLSPDAPVIGAQVLEAVRHEMALSLEDVVLRRTSLGTTGYPGDAAAREAAALMQEELAWSAERVEDEIDSLRRYYATPARPESERPLTEP
jgi:glycerol-3-phosphate dehydrogenase